MVDNVYGDGRSQMDKLGLCSGICPSRGLHEAGRVAVAQAIAAVKADKPSSPPTYTELESRFPNLNNLEIGSAKYCLQSCILPALLTSEEKPDN